MASIKFGNNFRHFIAKIFKENSSFYFSILLHVAILLVIAITSLTRIRNYNEQIIPVKIIKAPSKIVEKKNIQKSKPSDKVAANGDLPKPCDKENKEKNTFEQNLSIWLRDIIEKDLTSLAKFGKDAYIILEMQRNGKIDAAVLYNDTGSEELNFLLQSILSRLEYSLAVPDEYYQDNSYQFMIKLEL